MFFLVAILVTATTFGANPASRITESLNILSGEWSNFQKIDYQYDNNKKLISEISFRWNYQGNFWTQSQKTEYRYSGNKLAEKLVFNFFAPEEAWKPLYRSKFSYDKNKAVETLYSYNNYAGKTEDWTLMRKVIITYKKGLQVAEDVFGWNSVASEFFVMSKSVFTVENGKITEKLLYNDKDAEPHTRTIYVYNAENQLVSEKTAEVAHKGKSSEYRYIYF
jgi:hypothetical protein